MSKTKMVPVPKDLAAEQIGVGIHTGIRKGSDAPEAAALWGAISDSTQAWSDGIDYLLWGMGAMGWQILMPEPASTEVDN